MKRHARAKLPALCGALYALAPSAAWAVEHPCPAVALVSDEGLGQRWPDLVRRVREEVLSRNDVDACANISLKLEAGATIRVQVTLADGRAASRGALRSEDVIPTLQALLLMPDRVLDTTTTRHPDPAPANGSSSEHSHTRTRALTRYATEASDPSGPSLVQRAGGLGVELSVIGGARIGDGQASYGLGAHSLLDISGWLLGFEGRVDRYHQLSGAQTQAALELGALAGKRIRFRGITLDVTAGPGFAIKGALSSQTEVALVQGSPNQPSPPPQQEPPPSEPSSGVVPRLLTGVHLGFSPHSVLRSFVGVDGTFGPARADGLGPNSPSMPRWTLGLTLGATVGTP